jgi:hypothetical protein
MVIGGGGAADRLFDLAWRGVESGAAGLGLRLTNGQKGSSTSCEVHCSDCPSCPAYPACQAGTEWCLLLFLVVFLVAYWLGTLSHRPRAVKRSPPPFGHRGHSGGGVGTVLFDQGQALWRSLSGAKYLCGTTCRAEICGTRGLFVEFQRRLDGMQ